MLALDIELEADKHDDLEQLLASPNTNDPSTAELCTKTDQKGGDTLPIAA
jgi:hypothetical protein